MENINVILGILIILNIILVVFSFVILNFLKKIQYALKQPIAKKLSWNKKVKPYNKDKNKTNNGGQHARSQEGRSERPPRQRTRIMGTNEAGKDVLESQGKKMEAPLPQRQPQQPVGENIPSDFSKKVESNEEIIKHGRRTQSR